MADIATVAPKSRTAKSGVSTMGIGVTSLNCATTSETPMPIVKPKNGAYARLHEYNLMHVRGRMNREPSMWRIR